VVQVVDGVADVDWCAVDDCPAVICNGPHESHLCGDSIVTRRFDDHSPCPFCGVVDATDVAGRSEGATNPPGSLQTEGRGSDGDHVRVLAKAIVKIAEAAGMGTFGDLTGPQVLLIADDTAEWIKHRRQGPPHQVDIAPGVTGHELARRINYELSFHRLAGRRFSQDGLDGEDIDDAREHGQQSNGIWCVTWPSFDTRRDGWLRDFMEAALSSSTATPSSTRTATPATRSRPPSSS
jgi:hypothetical protein